MNSLTARNQTATFTDAKRPIRLPFGVSVKLSIFRVDVLTLACAILAGLLAYVGAQWSGWGVGLTVFAITTLLGLVALRGQATRFSNNRQMPLRTTIAFTLRAWRDALLVGLIPACIFLANSAGTTVCGWIGISTVGIDGLATGTLSLCFACWPLVLAAIATESCDAFDAVSRVVHFALSRPLLFFARVAPGWAVLTGTWFVARTYLIDWVGLVPTFLIVGPAFACAVNWFLFAYLHLRECIDAIECDELSSLELSPVEIPLCGRAAHPIDCPR